MLKYLVTGWLVVAVSAKHHHDNQGPIKNEDRACPDGFFYAGEPDHKNIDPDTRNEIWEEGPASPVYSCYKFIQRNTSFAGGSLACNEEKAELVSVNNDFETILLINDLFADHMPDQMLDDLKHKGETLEVWTSGIQLGDDLWTWFGEDMEIDSEVVDQIEMNSTNSPDVQCLALRWEKNGNGTTLVFTNVPCTKTMQRTLCEVRVYTQIWYVWFYTNWLQILFFLTMGILLLSTCCMFQALFMRKTTTVRRGAVLQASPPPYTPNPIQGGNGTTNKYAMKGREMLAKISFIKPKDEEKIRLSDA